MKDFAAFILSIFSELYELWAYAQKGASDPEKERQLAMSVIRKAKDAQARKELGDT